MQTHSCSVSCTKALQSVRPEDVRPTDKRPKWMAPRLAVMDANCHKPADKANEPAKKRNEATSCHC